MALVCSKCGFDNPARVGACAKCASPLANLCPRCGFEIPNGLRFCGSCGANLLNGMPGCESEEESLRRLRSYIPGPLVEKVLDVGQVIEGERRTVAVLFSDVVGFTSIAERLDPEQVYSILDTCTAAFRDSIYEHEGWLDKFTSDGVMALFGAPVAHENDAARAVRCALGMQDALQRINEDLVARYDIRLQMRIGLNLGTVVVGNVGSDLRMNYTALGDGVNVAARLQAIAEPGTIVASRAVYELTRAHFEFRELGTVQVKGRVEPVEICKVIGPRRQPGPVRGIPGLSAPMVGRDQELATMQAIVETLIHQHSGAAVLVTGEPGMGKSRLVAEVKQFAARVPVRIFEGGCLAYGQSAYDVFIRLLTAYFDLHAADDELSRRDKIGSRVRSIVGSDHALAEILPYLENLLGVPVVEKEMAERIRHLDPAQLRRQTFIAVRGLFVAHAEREPLMLILKDLHWLDKVSLNLLQFLFNAVDEAPLCLLGTSRPSDNQIAPQLRRAGEASQGDKFVHIDLKPLSPDESATLIDLLLAVADLPESLRRLISQRAEGNPFYLEEILRMLIDRHIIRRQGERWEMAPHADLANVTVPHTVEGLIMARVDNLPEATRYLLQCASVIGRDFSQQLLCQITDNHIDRLELGLQELQDHELICKTNWTERQFKFRHVLTQQTVYNSLLLRRREHLHHRIAEAIEELYRGHFDDVVEQLAYHYTESADAPRALPYLLRAAERAAARFANEEALSGYRSALDLANQANATLEQRINIFCGLGDAQNFLGDYASALASFRTALELAMSAPPALAHSRRVAEIARKLGRVCERRGEHNEAMRWLQSALRELEYDPTSQDAVERVRAYLDLGWIHYRLGHLEEAYQWQTRALEVAKGRDYYAESASAYNRLAALFIYKGDWAGALDYAERGLKLRELSGDLDGVGRSHVNLGAIAASSGNWSAALEHFKASLALNQRIGQPKEIAKAYANLGSMYVLKGEAAEARVNLIAGLKIAEKIHDPDQTCQALNALGEAELLTSNWPGALERLQRSVQTASETGAKEQLAQASWLLAEAELGLGRPPEAERAAHHALQLAQEIGIRQVEASAYRALGAVQRKEHRWREAEADLSRSITIFNDLKNPYETARSELELALLYEEQGMQLDARALLQRCSAIFTRFGVDPYRERAGAALARSSRNGASSKTTVH